MSVADAQRFLRIVQHDMDVLDALAQGAPVGLNASDWKVTITFYMPCMYVTALAAHRGVQLEDHVQRREWIHHTPDVKAIYTVYKALEDRSRDARYKGKRFTLAEMSQALAWFGQVRDLVVALLSQAGVPNVPAVDPSQALQS